MNADGATEREFGSGELASLMRVVDRLDALADVADLMGDPDGAERLRREATGARMRAMQILDD